MAATLALAAETPAAGAHRLGVISFSRFELAWREAGAVPKGGAFEDLAGGQRLSRHRERVFQQGFPLSNRT